jgi:hypothetical protein
MNITMKQLLAAAFATALTSALVIPTAAHTQEEPGAEPAIENQPESADEPSIDDLLGLDDDAAEDEPDAKPDESPDADEPPKLTRDLDKALTGKQAADQFAQAIDEMEEVAIRLSDEEDPGIDTQRMQDEIILKLEQIIASAEKTKSKQKPKPGQGKPQQGKPREADKQQGQQPGEQQGEKPGEKPGEQQGDKPGDQEGQKPGEKPGEGQGEQQGEKPGEGEGQQQGDKPGSQSGQNGSQGSVRNEELSMKDLREGEWGNLPPRLRDELAESLSETFNPVYRAATEAFYRRIAEMSQQQAEEGE